MVLQKGAATQTCKRPRLCQSVCTYDHWSSNSGREQQVVTMMVEVVFKPTLCAVSMTCNRKHPVMAKQKGTPERWLEQSHRLTAKPVLI